MASQDLVPAAVPAPVPTTRVRISSTTASPYTNGVAHSSRRGDTRYTAAPIAVASTIHPSCFCQIAAMSVGTSVWPAEYSVARPRATRAPTVRRVRLSRPREAIARDRVRQDRHRLRRRVARPPRPVVCRREQRGHGPQQAPRDDAIYHGRDRRAVLGKLHHGTHHDPRTVHRSEPDVPRVVRVG